MVCRMTQTFHSQKMTTGGGSPTPTSRSTSVLRKQSSNWGKQYVSLAEQEARKHGYLSFIHMRSFFLSYNYYHCPVGTCSVFVIYPPSVNGFCCYGVGVGRLTVILLNVRFILICEKYFPSTACIRQTKTKRFLPHTVWTYFFLPFNYCSLVFVFMLHILFSAFLCYKNVEYDLK